MILVVVSESDLVEKAKNSGVSEEEVQKCEAFMGSDKTGSFEFEFKTDNSGANAQFVWKKIVEKDSVKVGVHFVNQEISYTYSEDIPCSLMEL